jgi:hypothetical protein
MRRTYEGSEALFHAGRLRVVSNANKARENRTTRRMVFPAADTGLAPTKSNCTLDVRLAKYPST